MGSAVRSSPWASIPIRKLLLPHSNCVVPAFFRLLRVSACVNIDPSPEVCARGCMDLFILRYRNISHF